MASDARCVHLAPWRAALCAGYERMLAWADVLDRINVFPVPDGDTGRNLAVSLAALRDVDVADDELVRRLLLSARGNSGNIAVEFVRRLIEPPSGRPLPDRFTEGAIAARRAVSEPLAGTMLSTLDVLARSTAAGVGRHDVERVIVDLRDSVKATAHGLEALRLAGTVDSGALGMLLFLDGFLREAFGLPPDTALADEFRALVGFTPSGAPVSDHGSCLDVVLRIPRADAVESALAEIGSDVVTLRDGELLKVHLHVEDLAAARASLARLGDVLRWSADDFSEQTRLARVVPPRGRVHIVTDAAASLSRRDAERLGITLLDSYVTLGDVSVPETRLAAEDAYAAMRRGTRVSTSQASTFERRACYDRLTRHHERVLYLCVGSAFTGNYRTASAWAATCAEADRFVVVDSGAASGRLAVVVQAAARRAIHSSLDDLSNFVREAADRAEEYVFIDRLEYLARGGRVTRPKAFFADLLNMAPVVTPMPDGVRKVAVLRQLEDKIAFACDRLARALAPMHGRGLVLIEYTDNREWVEGDLARRFAEVVPSAECHVVPMSLTSGVHMGPGTWGVAVLPDDGP